MKYFLTGISGFIGSNLAKKLATDGHTVNALVRNPATADVYDFPNIRIFKGDLFDRNVIDRAMDGCDAAFHLAAYAKPWSKNPEDFHRINVEGAVNIFTAAREACVKKIVFTSSAATMSPSDGEQPANEGTDRKIPYFNAYESTKAEAESRAGEFTRNGSPLVIVNPTRVYGPGPINPSNSVTKMIDGYRNGKWRIIPGDGSKIGNYVFIDDVVHGHILAAQKGRPGERYILGGENITFNEFFKILEKVTQKQYRMIHLPIGLMMSAARLMEWQAPVTGIPPAITAGFVKKYMNHWSLSSDKAISELGYNVTPFASGVDKTLEWLSRNQGI